MRKIPDNVCIYELTGSQASAVSMQDYCLHKNVVQVPMYLIVDRLLDFDLLRKAISAEIERNDCLRLFYFRREKKIFQYFLPKIKPPRIPFYDFSGKTEKEMLDKLKRDAARPVRFLNGESWRMMIFSAPENKSGIYININHASMDLYAVLAFFKDLLNVYIALENGTEMPKPMTRFEVAMQRDFILHADERRMNGHKKFFAEYWKNLGDSFYAGIDGMKQLKAERIATENPDKRYVNLGLSDLLHDKSETEKLHLDADLYDRMMNYCIENRVTMLSIIYLGIRTWLSKTNDRAEDVYLHSLIHRRSTIAIKNCGGCFMDCVPLRSIFSENMTFKDALKEITKTNNEIFRHSDLPSAECFEVLHDNENRPNSGNTAASLITFCPQGAFTPPDGWQCEIGGMGSGNFTFYSYILLFPDLVNGGLDCYYEHRTKRITAENVRDLHENMLKVIDAGLTDPDVTLGKLMDDLKN